MQKDLFFRCKVAGLIVVLFLSACVRFWQLNAVPPGLTHDEAAHGHDAYAILRGARPIYQTEGSYGREPLFDYFVGGLFTLLDNEIRALRLSSVFLNLVTLFASFAWINLAFDGTTALTSVAFQSASFWSLSTSRQALRSSLLPPLFTIAVYFYWRAIYQPLHDQSTSSSHWRLVIFAILIGATLYTYIPSRVLWIVFFFFLIYLVFTHRELVRRIWKPSFTALLISLLLALPLFAYLQKHPEAERRLDMLNAPLKALKSGNTSLIMANAWECVVAYFVPGHGDDFLAYNIPGRPIFDPLTGILFLLGIGISLVRWYRPAYAFSLIWLLIGISPSLITGSTASTTRSIGAIPVVFLFPALAVITCVRYARQYWGDWTAWIIVLFASMLILTSGVVSVHDYFQRWGQSAEVRAAYQHTLLEITEYVDKDTHNGIVVLSTVHPKAPHDPYIFEMSLYPDKVPIRWVDARRALILPQTSEAMLVAPASAQLSSYFLELPGIFYRERVWLRLDDLDPFFTVYDWNPIITLYALKKNLQEDGLYLDLDKSSQLEVPVNFGNALQFLGYDLPHGHIAPGEAFYFVTLWAVNDPQVLQVEEVSNIGELVFFTHALDSSGNIFTQEDRLDAPTWSWEANDIIAQIHQLEFPSNWQPSSTTLEIGVFRRNKLTRLPIIVNGVEMGNRILIQTPDLIDPDI